MESDCHTAPAASFCLLLRLARSWPSGVQGQGAIWALRDGKSQCVPLPTSWARPGLGGEALGKDPALRELGQHLLTD